MPQLYCNISQVYFLPRSFHYKNHFILFYQLLTGRRPCDTHVTPSQLFTFFFRVDISLYAHALAIFKSFLIYRCAAHRVLTLLLGTGELLQLLGLRCDYKLVMLLGLLFAWLGTRSIYCLLGLWAYVCPALCNGFVVWLPMFCYFLGLLRAWFGMFCCSWVVR